MAIAHIILVFGNTILAILRFNIKSLDGETYGSEIIAYQIASAATVFGGISEMFLSCMLWFIIDDGSLPPSIIVDQNNKIFYPVIDVIKD